MPSSCLKSWNLRLVFDGLEYDFKAKLDLQFTDEEGQALFDSMHTHGNAIMIVVKDVGPDGLTGVQVVPLRVKLGERTLRDHHATLEKADDSALPRGWDEEAKLKEFSCCDGLSAGLRTKCLALLTVVRCTRHTFEDRDIERMLRARIDEYCPL